MTNEIIVALNTELSSLFDLFYNIIVLITVYLILERTKLPYQSASRKHYQRGSAQS